MSIKRIGESITKVRQKLSGFMRRHISIEKVMEKDPEYTVIVKSDIELYNPNISCATPGSIKEVKLYGNKETIKADDTYQHIAPGLPKYRVQSMYLMKDPFGVWLCINHKGSTACTIPLNSVAWMRHY